MLINLLILKSNETIRVKCDSMDCKDGFIKLKNARINEKTGKETWFACSLIGMVEIIEE